MHLISHEAQGCITVRLRVFVSQHLPRTVTVSNPLKDIDVVSETHSCSDALSKHEGSFA